MKILKLDEFVKLPAGTIYSEYVPNSCTGLFRKGDTIVREAEPPCDFYCASIVAECEWNESIPEVHDVPSRWALFDHEALFAVYEPADLLKVKEMLGL